MEDNQKQLALDFILGDVVEKAKKTAATQVEELKNSLDKDILEINGKLAKLREEVDNTISGAGVLVNLGTIEEPKKERVHKVFNTITRILSSAKRKEKNIMLVGGAGGGKTHLVKQIAEALKLPFYPMSVGLQTTKSDLLGFINATGTYMPSIIRKAFEDGGVLLLDEFDAAHAGVVTILNSLLANGHASFPDKVVNKHKDFICIVACNTFGNGANMEYVGRNRLDGATLDRFITINVDYDGDLEKGLTNNDSWYSIIQQIRKNAEKQGIKQIISPRASMDGADLLDAGFSIKEVLKMVVFKGCSEEVCKKLTNGIDLENYRKLPESGPKKRVRRAKAEIEMDNDNEKFDYILDINFSRDKENMMKIIKYTPAVMDSIFGDNYSIDKDKWTLKFEHSDSGYSYGMSETSTTFWFPKTFHDCSQPFYSMENAKKRIMEILSEFIFQDFSFKFKVIVDGQEFKFGV